MSDLRITEDEPWIRVNITGPKDEPTMPDVRRAQAARAAYALHKGPVTLIGTGGSWDGECWGMYFSFVPAGYVFPERMD